MKKRPLREHPKADCKVVVFEQAEKWFISQGQRVGLVNPEGLLTIDSNNQTQHIHLKWWAVEIGIGTSVIDRLIYDRNLIGYNIYTGDYFYASDF